MRFAWSTRTDGSMRLAGLTGASDEPMLELNRKHRKAFLEQAGFGNKKIIGAQLVHGNRVARVDIQSPAFVLGTDGLITSDPHVALSITMADCFPVFFDDSKQGLVGIAHVGWRGALANIMDAMVKVMVDAGSTTADIAVTFGPGICQDHYSVSKEKIAPFRDRPYFSQVIKSKGDQFLFDIKHLLILELRKAGVTRITDGGECTYEFPEKYFSYRRDRPPVLETMLAIITLE